MPDLNKAPAKEKKGKNEKCPNFFLHIILKKKK